MTKCPVLFAANVVDNFGKMVYIIAMEKMSFGQFMAECRQKKGLTQKDLAEKLFVSESAVSKWEKDKRRPDLDLVSKLSEIFGITESELIRASVDVRRVKERKEARNFRIINSVYNLILYIGFSVALLTCFIVNLAVSHALSWFFIVLAAIILAFIILILPQFIKRHRLLIIPLSWLFGLYLLIGVTCLFTGGNWFSIPFFALLFAYSLIFTPLILRQYLKNNLIRHNLILSIAINFIVLLIMLFVIDIYTFENDIMKFGWSMKLGLPITLYWSLPLAASALIIRAKKMIWPFKTSLMIIIWPIFQIIFDIGLSRLLGISNESQYFWAANFSNWSTEDLISANVMLIVNLSLVLIALAFSIIGIIIQRKRKNTPPIKAKSEL